MSNTRIRAILFSLLFVVSSVGASVLIAPASATPATLAAAAPAATPLTQAQANWEYPNGNAWNQDYNPQNQINPSNAGSLGLSWIYPLPGKTTALQNYGAGGVGVGMQVIIVNGTAFATTVFDETLAFNVANGNVLWTYTVPLNLNSSAKIPGAGQGRASQVTLHAHDGNEWFTSATIGSTISGPTLWIQGQDKAVYAINALTGKQELNFSDFTGRSMVPGDGPGTTYHSVGATNLLVDPARGILISSLDAESSSDNGRGFFAGWNIKVNPPTLLWVSTDTPPQPGGNVPLNPNWDIQSVQNMSQNAETFYPGQNGSTNGYTTATELRGGVMQNVKDDIVVNYKTMSASALNATLYNDWGQVAQTAACQAITGGASTGTTGAGWGGPWVLGTGTTSGMAFVSTNNKDPFTGPCNPGPNLWSAAILALNVTNGKWIWGFQTTTHDIWDYDCSWWQALANETIGGASTPVIIKTCKNGFLFEINALTGDLIWAWSPPTNIIPRCPICWPMNPSNTTQTSADFPTALQTYKTQPETGAQPPFLQYPSELAGFEDEQSYDPSTNTIFAASHIVPYFMKYLGLNSSTYYTSTGETGTPVNKGSCSNCAASNNNSTIWSINAATGAINWHYLIPLQGFRGAVTVSGGLVYSTLSSGDVLMLNESNGALVRDYYIGAPMDVAASIGASVNGQEFIIVPVGTCSFEAVVTCPGTTPGDIVALTLTGGGGGPGTTTTVTQTSTTTTTTTSVSTSTSVGPATTITTTINGQVSTITIPGSTTTITQSGAGGVTTTTLPGSTTTVTSSTGGVSSAALYGVAAVAVIFIIATGYLAMRGRRPAS